MIGQRVRIVLSSELEAWKLKKLKGREGKITSESQNEKNRGRWVELDYPYNDEIEWFIPTQSIQLISSTNGKG